MSRCRILVLKWRDRHVENECRTACADSGNGQRQCKFFRIDAPVRTQLDLAAEREQTRQHRVRVPATLELVRLRPWIRVEQVLMRAAQARGSGNFLKIHKFTTQQQRVRRSRAAIYQAPARTEPHGGLVDAKHEPPGKFARKRKRACTGAATSVEHERRLRQSIDDAGEGLAPRRARFASIRRGEMARNNLAQARMWPGLTAADLARIRKHDFLLNAILALGRPQYKLAPCPTPASISTCPRRFR